MSVGTTTDGTSGLGSNGQEYSVPRATEELFNTGLLKNPLVSRNLPKEAEECSKSIRFEGNESPSIPINWRFAESISSLKGLEATMINILLKRKYNVDAKEVVINTDHAQLFVMSAFLWVLDPDGEKVPFGSPQKNALKEKYFPDYDLHGAGKTPYRTAATNIYRCKDGRYFHLHGSMNAHPTQDSLGLPHDNPTTTYEESIQPYIDKLSQIDSATMQPLASDQFKQAGTICWTTDEYKTSAHGRANSHISLWDIHSVPNPTQPPCWWPSIAETGPSRPLAGLKVIDLTRVIAAPAVTRGLAELGASVLRITAPHVTDMTSLHPDLCWGKWNAHLDLRDEGQRETMRGLILEADVVVSGYRPGVMDKYGFSQEEILELCKGRERGVVVVRENCYGWNGEWSYRSGWQQISDANCGVSMEFGRAMGNDEPVTPVFPNSDYCTGVAGVIGILDAILRRGSDGGSYKVDLSLNYYSQWLVNSVGVYPDAVWQDVWNRNGRLVFRHYHHMGYTIPRFMKMLTDNAKDVVLKDEFFENRPSRLLGKPFRTVKPVIQYRQGPVELRYNVSTRGNGIDKPQWPKDLMTELIA
ncbi:CoA-transferase family III [Eremomyces bilateralis CBS 781.70]|uniref:CoA-transferase family III n=1 Tax=Eremomyces bilateralis CBS 781.70 TaxID=1392243 RepID=A0A6G1G1U3_9PEZI|nr:CoA-transferase family III [Eremomyces bilateralis CBS 781.70]KAF1812013.1 CoA-transferase family III [Eremomyces bilateralis CBS 781.70]